MMDNQGPNFTDRFILLPIKVFDADVKELTGNCTYEDSWMKILPNEICQYKPSIDSENGDVECVSVRMKNGDCFYVYMNSKQFEKKLNEHSLYNAL